MSDLVGNAQKYGVLKWGEFVGGVFQKFNTAVCCMSDFWEKESFYPISDKKNALKART